MQGGELVVFYRKCKIGVPILGCRSCSGCLSVGKDKVILYTLNQP